MFLIWSVFQQCGLSSCLRMNENRWRCTSTAVGGTGVGQLINFGEIEVVFVHFAKHNLPHRHAIFLCTLGVEISNWATNYFKSIIIPKNLFDCKMAEFSQINGLELSPSKLTLPFA